MKKLMFLWVALAFSAMATAQDVIPLGKGSYAAYAPYSESATTDHGGCHAYYMEHRPVYLTENAKGKPIPSNDWWTDLLVSQYSGELWAYPQKACAMSTGIRIEFPTYWNNTGNEVHSKSHVNVGAQSFYPESAAADDWHDWGFRFAMQDGGKQMMVTLAHGIPFTWIECTGIVPYLAFDDATFIVNGQTVQPPFVASSFVLQVAGDNYAVYAPDNTNFVISDKRLEARFSGADSYLVVGVLPDAESLSAFEPYAYNVPRNTEVSWNYVPAEGKLKTYWNVTAENLKGGANTQVLQGFIPHHYKNSTCQFSFLTQTYLTPRGTMKLAAGNAFEIDYDYNGVLPFYPQPEVNGALANPYNRARMVSMIEDYAKKGTFGADTYWGGKGLTQMAHYMCFAHEMGETELFEMCKNRLKAVLIDWLTYTPGETQKYFAYYPRWGAMVGFDPSYDSDTFNDHHFHYGYYTYSSALLAMFDEEFKRDYGPMITLVARDYANWEHDSADLPFFRTLDPWCGHSFAGGMGGWQGNGQESSSEAMQGWGGMLLLGAALGNDAMRDAGIFGYVLEARATAEYWFDRDRENIDYTKYKSPWSTNLTTQGVGWWTWFSGDPVWMHSIQWLPISPILKYLYEDLDFARWDFETMMEGKDMGDWAEQGGLGGESGIGNVCLSYMQIFDPDGAAAIFDQMWNGNFALAKNTDTGGITYFITHMHRTYGEIQWNIHADQPLTTAYAKNGKYYYVIYNPTDQEQTVTFYEGAAQRVRFKAPANKLTVYSDAPVLTSIQVTSPATTVARGAQAQMRAVAYDQYGATMNNVMIAWNTTAGTVNNAGMFTAPNANGNATITATSGGKSGSVTVRVNNAPVLTSAELLPSVESVEVGTEMNYTVSLLDQYGDPFVADRTWTINYGGAAVAHDSVFAATNIGTYTVQVNAAGNQYQRNLLVLPVYPNIALNKTCTASSAENGGTGAANATDGSNTSRWSSLARDGEWLYVDLGVNSFISSVGIKWEAAFASQYQIQLSDDATNWNTVKLESGTNGYVLTNIGQNGRYVRIYGVERATNYGISMYELEVFGVAGNLPNDAILGLDITPKTNRMLESETLQLTAKAYNKNAQQVNANITWNVVSGNATISNTGLLTPNGFGEVVVSATANGATSTRTILVEESVRLETIELVPSVAFLVRGEQQTFTVKAYDQFGTEIDASGYAFTYQLTGAGSTLNGNVFTAGNNGNYTVTARYNNKQATADVTVANFGNINLALNKKTSCSSYEGGGTLPSNVNDGDYISRWGSMFNDGEYIIIDLEGYYNVNDIKIFWQEAYATEYHIEVSMDEERWEEVFRTVQCHGGDEDVQIAETPARYIRVTADKRYNAGWGVSIREIEVYGSSEAEAPYPVELQILPPYTFYLGSPVQLRSQVIDQYGHEMKQNPLPTFYVNGGGTISPFGVFTPTEVGTWVLGSDFNNQVSNGCEIQVKEAQRLSSIVLVPATSLASQNTDVAIAAYVFDQYGNQMDANLNWTTNLGTVNNGVFRSANQGTATIQASANGVTGTCSIQVIGALVNNLALNKPAYSSSGNAALAVDGNPGSRWESAFSDPQWLYVDLQGVYQLTSMEILWETASAKDYDIQVSNDGTNWVSILEVTDKPAQANRVDTEVLGGVGRYVRVYGKHRTTDWGYSIYELRLYGVELPAGQPYSIQFVNPVTQLKTRRTYQYEVVVKDKNGNTLNNQQIIWAATGGSINAYGEYLPSEAGNQLISASVGNLRVELAVQVELNTQVAEQADAEFCCYRSADLLHVSGQTVTAATLYDMAGRLTDTATAAAGEYLFSTIGRRGVYLVLVQFADGTKQVVKVVL
ncbi:MAG: discoidin domain-containing protein [Paludibacteraceae bacterium]|nr:discoidin domain-containing protein [Paludibacteraceae bacterium]